MAQILAAGNDEATSADFVVTAGQMPTIFLKDAAEAPITRPQDYGVGVNSHVFLQLKSAEGLYFTVAVLDAGKVDERGVTLGAGVIAGSGTFRVYRPPSQIAVGVDLA